jgi:hypothetical protein
MRAITLWQPWATLVIEGSKQYETRGVKTNIRGLVAIHAAKTKRGFGDCIPSPYINGYIIGKQFAGGTFPLGCVLGIVLIEDVFKTEDIVAVVPDQEIYFGDWSRGRYAWKLKVIKKYEKPVPWKGQQGFWKWDGFKEVGFQNNG